MHRATGQHGLRAQRFVAAVDAHLPQHFAQRVLGATVDDDAHRTVVVVLADQRDAAREIGFGQRRQRDQQLIGQGLGHHGHGVILARGPLRAR